MELDCTLYRHLGAYDLELEMDMQRDMEDELKKCAIEYALIHEATGEYYWVPVYATHNLALDVKDCDTYLKPYNSQWVLLKDKHDEIKGSVKNNDETLALLDTLHIKGAYQINLLHELKDLVK